MTHKLIKQTATYVKRKIKILMIKNIVELKLIVTVQVNTEVFHTVYVRYRVPKKIPVVLHNGLYYDYHFIMKELAEEFKGQFQSLGENTEKYRTFLVLINREMKKLDKKENK